MNSRSDKFEYSLAGPGDGRELLEVYESGDFKGGISVLYTRRPDACTSLSLEGDKAVIPVMRLRENGKIIGTGGCVIREAYINGKLKRVGYLTGLKILPEYRKHVPNIKEVYCFLYEQTKNVVDIYYTTILKDNMEAQRILEKRRKNMPEYNYRGEYTVYCFKAGNKVKGCDYVFEVGNTKGLEQFYDMKMRNYNLSNTNINMPGIAEKDILTLRNPDGEIIAAGLLWNQQSYKQYIITGYGGLFRILKYLPLDLIGYPKLPKVNSTANYASLAMFHVKDDNPDIAEHFIKKAAEFAKQYDFLMLGMFENHPLNFVFNKIKHVKYQSKLYTVHFDPSGMELDGRVISLDVGLL